QVLRRAVSRRGSRGSIRQDLPGVLSDRSGHRRSQRHRRHRLTETAMIKNERQYRITRAQAHRFDQALRQLSIPSARVNGLHTVLRKAQEDALRSQLEDLREQLAEYDALRSGQRKVLEAQSFAELPRALIRARIAAGLS